MLDGDGEDAIPLAFKSYKTCRLPDEYEDLYRRLTGQPAFVPAPLGRLCEMPAVSAGIPEALAAMVEVLAVHAQSPVDAERKTLALILRLAAERAAEIARQRGLAEAEKLAELAKQENELRRATQQNRKIRAELARVERERDQLVAQLGERDRTLQAELAAYRE